MSSPNTTASDHIMEPPFPKRTHYSGVPLPSGRGHRVHTVREILSKRAMLVEELFHWAISTEDIGVRLKKLRDEARGEEKGEHANMYKEASALDWPFPTHLTSNPWNDVEACMQWLEDMFTWNYESEDFKASNIRKFAAYYAYQFLSRMYDPKEIVEVLKEVAEKVKTTLKPHEQLEASKELEASGEREVQFLDFEETSDIVLPKPPQKHDRSNLLNDENIRIVYTYTPRQEESEEPSGKVQLTDVTRSSRGRAVAVLDFIPETGPKQRRYMEKEGVEEWKRKYFLIFTNEWGKED